ncbi:MAG: cytochrome-c oxidase, cbb3-type subunit III [Burkholderiales bacterium]|jgi:cytochrome c oxidase cbb3-type subunit 3|nr:cytochrome-c oxidase, cbb3-type subunit III [Burkholderiales bacterium]
MSDFLHGGWSVYIAVATVLGLAGCLFLLVVASRTTQMAADNTTGHVFDGDLVEMNNPLPRWWMVLFVLTVIFAVVYGVLFPTFGNMPGVLGWSSQAALERDQARALESMQPVYARFAGMAPDALAADPEARAISERLYVNQCAMCHGSDARGSKGFPNLSDGDWLHGGSHEKIVETITQGRQGVMPPMGAAVGTDEDIRNVAHYVMSLSNTPHDAARATAGKEKFVVCGACHGADGKGNPAVGAPNLTDDIWLHGAGEAAITAMIRNGKTNVMPAQAGRLTPTQIDLLAAYVGSLSKTPAR